MNESAINAWHVGLADEAEPIEQPEDDVLSSAELARLAYIAEYPELENWDLAQARQSASPRASRFSPEPSIPFSLLLAYAGLGLLG